MGDIDDALKILKRKMRKYKPPKPKPWPRDPRKAGEQAAREAVEVFRRELEKIK